MNFVFKNDPDKESELNKNAERTLKLSEECGKKDMSPFIKATIYASLCTYYKKLEWVKDLLKPGSGK
jgi:hypothetical protein